MIGNEMVSKLKFPFEIGWTRNYEDLFRGEYTTKTGVDDILEKATKHGRVMLFGKGGSGKTTIARRVRDTARDRGFSTVLIDMLQWSPRLHDIFERHDEDPLAQANFLLTSLGDPPLPFSAIDEMDPEQPKLVIIDGLNEVRLNIGQQLIIAADRLAASFLNLSVITTDRLVRRDIKEGRWVLGMVLPLKEQEVQQIVSDALGQEAWRTATARQRQMLENPFFLDKVLEDGRFTLAIGDYLRRHTGLSENGMEAAARGAFVTYRTGFGGRSFLRDTFVKEAGQEATGRLEEAGVLVEAEKTAHFQHHLFHDYLAASYLAAHTEEWGEVAFDALSFKASSFDAISKVLDQLEADQADEFIRNVYDWNPYAAAYAISETGSSERRVSKEMEHVITAMLAERMGDIFQPTVIRARDALAILGSDQAQSYLKADSFDKVLAAVDALESRKEWFCEWQQLFTRQPDSELEDGQLELLKSEDSILGWTIANVLRRLVLSDKQLRYVRELAESAKSGAVRWRAVHILGAFPTKHNEAVLLKRLEKDQYEWVQYGALRSLMEMAASSPVLRSEILETLSRKADLLANRNLLRGEFSRAVFANIEIEEFESWKSGLGRIVRALADRAQDERDLEQWARLSRQLSERYAA